jgi:DNA-binding response OmpR family regulator
VPDWQKEESRFQDWAERHGGNTKLPKVLIVEDDIPLAEMVANYLRFEHYLVEIVDNGDDALSHLEQNDYEIAVLDWNIPGLMNGLEVCKAYRARGGMTPILMLTGKGSIDEKTTGLDSGADDYLTKPFQVRELASRLRALLRRSSLTTSESSVLELGALKLDIDNYRVTFDAQEIKLIPKEFRLLEVLMRKPGRVFSADELIRKIWLANEEGSSDSVRTHIKNLRQKLTKSNCTCVVETVHGVGYRISASDADQK